jgi:hypothetical protein
MEAASRGLRPEELSAADRDHLTAISRQARRRFVQAEVLPGSRRCGGPHEVSSYHPAWRGTFAS